MATQDGRRVNRPYRKASEYLSHRQFDGSKSVAVLEQENAELREKLSSSVRKLETMEVEYEQSREYFANQLTATRDKLTNATRELKVMQQSYSELQSINYGLEQRILKVSMLERERSQLNSNIHELSTKLAETKASMLKMQQENERLRKDCNLAVSLLECNAGNFKPQRVEELPRELQTRVETFQMDLTQYNEYVNPYADESDSDIDVTASSQYRTGTDEMVPPELLANVLKKSEGITLEHEYPDCVPELNSPYKGQILEKKLIKHDYSPQFQKMKPPVSANSNNNQRSTYEPPPASSNPTVGQSSSPWELAPTVAASSSSGSPWEMSSDVPVQDYEDDYSAASAYGAYPVPYKNTRPRRKQAPTRFDPPVPEKSGEEALKKSAYNKTKMSTTYNTATSTAVQKPSQKGTGENKDVYIAENNVSEAAEESKSRSSGSSQSSRKSTPGKVPTSTEKGSSAEKSSLLDQEGSDEEDLLMTIEYENKGFPKVGMGFLNGGYREKKLEVEGRGLLRRDSDPEPDERELTYEDPVTIRKEFDDDDDGEEVRESVGESADMQHVRESVKHEPEVADLMNLDDNTQLTTSTQTSHQLLLEQNLLGDVGVMSQSTLLPDLPPPTETHQSNEMILSEAVLAPPPPDMFGGPRPGILNYNARHISPPAYMPPMPYTQPMPRPLYQPPMMHHRTPEPVVTSPPNPLDDLKSVVDKEFEAAQSPQKSMSEKVTEMPSGGELLEGAKAGPESSHKAEGDTLGKSEVPNVDVATSALVSEYIDSVTLDLDSDINEVEEAEQNPTLMQEAPDLVIDNQDAAAGNILEEAESLEQKISDLQVGSQEDQHLDENSESVQPQTDEDVGVNPQTDDPLVVLELEKEPKSGTYGRRRRDSFEKAREYGNVIVD